MLTIRKSNTSLLHIVLLSLILLCISCCRYSEFLMGSPHTTTPERQSISPPVAKIIPEADTLHGDVRIDNYYWLRDRANPEVIEYLEAENKYTEDIMKHTEKFQKQLYKELLGRIKETDLSVPEKIDDYYYYSRTEEGKQYRIFCRKKGELNAKEEILLDQNELAKGYDYFRIGAFEITLDHQLLAYSIDTTGSETYTLYIKDLNTGELLKDEIKDIDDYIAWTNDSKTIFYATQDATRRPYKVYRHSLGTTQKEDKIVYHEKDEAFYVYISKTKSKKYLLITSGSKTTTEIRYLNANSPKDSFKIIHPRQHKMKYYIDHHNDKFYILTNDNAKNFKLMEVSVHNPLKKNWKEVIPHRNSIKIDDFSVFKSHLVVYERENGLKKIRIMNLVNNEIHYVDFPEPVYSFRQGANPDFNSKILRFTYMSLVTPRSVFDYNMDTRSRELKKQYEILGGYDPSLYQSERIFAQAQDGTMIPISLVYKKGMVKNGSNPLFLTGYGAYGASFDPYFSSNRLSLLNRGFIYAIAHIRGGGEMGEYWYEQGKYFNKMNTFTDFITCAEHLIAEKYTSSDKLVINGASAGGLLMGAVANLRTDLFKAVIADVPFVDVLNTMLDSSLPLTVLEYEEWGNPNEKEYYDYMKSYSPYDNVEAKEYSNMLITAGLNDTRVSYWEAAKWTAKLRALKIDNNLLLLKTNMGAGHGGASGRYDYLKDIAFEFVFIFDLLGIKK